MSVLSEGQIRGTGAASTDGGPPRIQRSLSTKSSISQSQSQYTAQADALRRQSISQSRASSMRSVHIAAKSVREMAEMSAEDLFETSTVEEIRQIEKKTRQDIEEKKEDLRQLVGARYRDLIESADSIMHMTKLALAVVEAVTNVQHGCASLHNSITQPEAELSRKQKDQSIRRKIFAVGSLVKLLADTPEQIWLCLDNHRHLEAANRYREAETVFNQLQNQPQTEMATMLSSWPLLQQLWTNLHQFQPVILKASRARLNRPGLSDSDYGRALSALVLLDQQSAQQALSSLLHSRSAWLARHLSETHSALTSATSAPASPSATVRDCLCSLAETIQLTVCHIASLLFVPTSSPTTPPLLISLLRRAPRSPIGQHWWVEDGPEELPPEPIAPEDIRKACWDWLESVQQEVAAKAALLLQHVERATNLADIQRAVHGQIETFRCVDSRIAEADEALNSAQLESSMTWEEGCQIVLKRPVNIWSSVFSSIFVSRAQGITLKLCEDLSLEPDLSELLASVASPDSNPPDRDVGEYLWSGATAEEKEPAARATKTRKPPRPSADKEDSFLPYDDMDSDSSLAASYHRAYGLTPKVAAIVQSFDAQLRSVLSEIKCLLEADAASSSGQTDSQTGSSQQLALSLQQTCSQAVRKLIRTLEDRVADLARQVYQAQPQAAIEDNRDQSAFCAPLEQALIVGRVCAALATSSRYLPVAISSLTIPTPSKPDRNAAPRPSVSYFASIGLGTFASPDTRDGSQPEESNVLLKETRGSLEKVNQTACSLWVRHVAMLAGSLLESSVHSIFTEVSHRINNSAAWEEVVISEESTKESGGTALEDKIKLPCHASTHVFAFLYTVASEIHRRGSFTLSKEVLRILARDLCERAVSIYSAFISSHIASQQSQGRAAFSDLELLQLMFDVRFILDVLRAGWADGDSSEYDAATGRPVKDKSFVMPKSARGGFKDSFSANKELAARVDSLLDMLQKMMDPIDWATYEKPLAQFIHRYYLRCILLFGHLVHLNRVHVPGGSAAARKVPPPNVRYETNILPLAKVVPRFITLPVSMPASSQPLPTKAFASPLTAASPRPPAPERSDSMKKSLAAAQAAWNANTPSSAGAMSYLEQMGSSVLGMSSRVFGFTSPAPGSADRPTGPTTPSK